MYLLLKINLLDLEIYKILRNVMKKEENFGVVVDGYQYKVVRLNTKTWPSNK